MKRSLGRAPQESSSRVSSRSSRVKTSGGLCGFRRTKRTVLILLAVGVLALTNFLRQKQTAIGYWDLDLGSSSESMCQLVNRIIPKDYGTDESMQDAEPEEPRNGESGRAQVPLPLDRAQDAMKSPA
eukprot:9484287-Pyramimonas_sp.AAC.1